MCTLGKVDTGLHRPLLLAGLLAGLLVAGCGGERPAAEGGSTEEGGVATIEGSVTYRERIMLPPGFDLVVELQDVSRADALATTLSSVTLQPEGGPPYPFSLEYDAAAIDPRMRYALRATLSREGRLLFTTNEYIDPFAGNPLEIVVQRVAEPVRHSPGR